MGSGQRRVLYTAAHHANEWITATLLLAFAEDLAKAAIAGAVIGGYPGRELLEVATIHMVPMVDQMCIRDRWCSEPWSSGHR